MKLGICSWVQVIGLSGCLVATQGEPWGMAAVLLPQTETLPPISTPQPAQVDASRPRTLTSEERADIFMARKAYADAVDYYNRALKQSNYADPVVWNKLGIAYQQQMNYRGANKAYKRAIHYRKDFAEPWNNLGTAYYMQNKYRKSVKYYLHAIRLHPDSASYHLNLGTSYYHIKKYKESVEEYRTALHLDPNILAEHSAVGTVVQARGAEPEYFFCVAKVFASLGRAEEAVRYLRRAFEDGFNDQKRLEEDPDFQKISQHPAYVELIKNRPVPIKD